MHGTNLQTAPAPRQDAIALLAEQLRLARQIRALRKLREIADRHRREAGEGASS